MKAALIALTLSPLLCMAEPVMIEPAGVALTRPADWKELSKETFAGAPSNVCFPRLQKNSSRIDSVIWKDADSLEEALDQYISRFSRWLKEGETFKETKRERFKTDSGVEGVICQLERTQLTGCGPVKIHLSRYIFRNSNGKIICLGGIGDLEEIHRIVISSLSLQP